MNKYKVTLPFLIFVTTEVEAESEDEAIEEAISHVELTNYCGNGGHDRLVGSYDSADSIECGDLFESGDIKATAELEGKA